MAKRNPSFHRLHSSYLFVEVDRHKRLYQEQHPDAKLINLGIGDTTQPLPSVVVKKLREAAGDLGHIATYSGYGPSFGIWPLRKAIAESYYRELVDAEEIYISDGAKCDIGRLQWLFDPSGIVAVQDPAYPAYVASSVIAGRSMEFDPEASRYEKIVYLSCKAENQFFPDLDSLPPIDLLFFCSPNNPTGAVATYEQLQKLVETAKANHFVIIFDAAYASYIRDASLPKSIYEIPGAREVAIEIGSFSKMIGFSGLRLGWSVVPNELVYADGRSIAKDWQQVVSTLFNGASIVSQKGGLALLQEPGMTSIQEMTDYYLKNARLLREVCHQFNINCFGADHSPYLWMHLPSMSSWEIFHYLLQEIQLITIPGSGFGSAGEHFVRISGLGHRNEVEEAAKRLSMLFSRQKG